MTFSKTAALNRALAAGFLVVLVPGIQPAGAAPDDYPDDPFAEHRRPLPADEIGTARGQMQLTALGALTDGEGQSDDRYFAGQITSEHVLHEFAGIRATAVQDLMETDFDGLDYRLSSVRFGPALHMRPYQRVDFGSYLEGGITVVDAFSGETADKAPEVALGGFVSVFVNSFVFVRLELQRSWTNLEIEGAMDDRNRTMGLMGIGVAF